MPANLPPQYFDVEKQYREAKDPEEKLVYLQQLLSIIPKHKGTEKLQADLKTRMKKIKETLVKQKKTKGSGGTWYQVEKQGAGQIVLVGLPNSGKSALVSVMTNANVEVADYPFTTQLPGVGMMEYQNIKIQIVDTPPLHADAPPWLFGLYRNGDILLFVLDGTHDVIEQFDMIRTALSEHNIYIEKHEYGDVKKTIIAVAKCDQGKTETAIQKLKSVYGDTFVYLQVSIVQDSTLTRIRDTIYQELNIIRIYTKKIGQSIQKQEPVVLPRGSTVIDAAEHIHKDFKKNLKFARLWNDKGYSGQRVEKQHILADEDVLEFHI
ncbi:TGS domain-containing protein [candidate division WOR-3 bacterium]|nr:TGS domain-containing protein [candidate division WOR-3 bacterium]